MLGEGSSIVELGELMIESGPGQALNVASQELGELDSLQDLLGGHFSILPQTIYAANILC